MLKLSISSLLFSACLLVPSVVSLPAKAARNTEQRINKLFDQLLTIEQQTLSWQCAIESAKPLFAEYAKDHPNKAEEYQALIKKLDSLKDSTSTLWIGGSLSGYGRLLPQATKDQFKSLPYATISSALSNAIGLNGKVSCDDTTGKHKHHSDL
jgi:hypothetical protein